MNDLAKATHDYKLPRRNFITGDFDHHPDGGDNSFGLLVNETYRIEPDRTTA